MAEGRKHRLSFKQLRLLFARGILRGSGKGKDRKVAYNKDASSKGASGGGTKPDHSATRAARVAAGKKAAEGFMGTMGGYKFQAAMGRLRQVESDPKKRLELYKRERRKNARDPQMAAVRAIQRRTAVEAAAAAPKRAAMEAERKANRAAALAALTRRR